VSLIVIIMTNNFLLLKLIVNEIFYCSINYWHNFKSISLILLTISK